MPSMTEKSASPVRSASPAPAWARYVPSGAMRALCPPHRVSEAALLQRQTNIWFSMARARESASRCMTRASGHWDTTNSISAPFSARVRASSGKRRS